jgi:hypothetical protein
MTIKWGSCACLAGWLALLAGCRTPQPNLKPEKTPEVLTTPTNEARYDSPGYPKQAFDTRDPTKIYSLDDKGSAATTAMDQAPGSRGMGGMSGGH